MNSCWWRHKIWNALRKWQSWGRRHKQTHKSAIDRLTAECRDRQAPSAIAISLHLLFLSPSYSPSPPLPLPHHHCNLNPHFPGIAPPHPFFFSPQNHLSSCSLVSVSSAQGGLGPTPPVHLPPLVFQLEAQREAEKLFALSLPLFWLCLGCSIKVSESMVWVLVSQGELWVQQPGDPRKKRMSVLLGEGWKRKREEGGMEGGQFKGSECQVLMCLFSITAVPGNDRERKQTATLIYYIQTFNSILKAVILQWKCLTYRQSTLISSYQIFTHSVLKHTSDFKNTQFCSQGRKKNP